jgi:KUP system potassium uptake protein
MVATIALVLGFHSSSGLAAAYGVAVTTTMTVSTVLFFFVARRRWKWSWWAAGIPCAVFLGVDLFFFAANIIKVAAGGWFPLAVGAVVLAIMVTWKTGRARLTAQTRSGELSTERFLGSIAAHPQQRVPGTAVYLFSNLGATPPPLLANLRHNEVLHETVLIVTVEWAGVPRVHRAKRATVHDLGEGFFQILLRYGFMETPEVPSALGAITTADFGFDSDDAIYVVGNETVIPRVGWSPRAFRDRLFAVMHRNSASPVRFFGLPPERVIEVGIQVEM